MIFTGAATIQYTKASIYIWTFLFLKYLNIFPVLVHS